MQATQDCKPLTFPKEYGMGRSFVGGDENEDRLRVRYYLRKSDKQFFAKVFFGKFAQGPPHHAHGGSMAAVLDEAMGLGALVAGYSVVAAKLSVEYVKMMPLNMVITVEVNEEKVDGRKVWMKAKIIGADGEIYSRSEGLYITIPIEKKENYDLHLRLQKEKEDE